MRAIGIMEFGGPEALELIDVPEVHAGPGEVRIIVRAATVNPTDVMTRNGTRAEQQKIDLPPYVPGMDIAGTVDEVGEGVTGIKAGDAVMGTNIFRDMFAGIRDIVGGRSGSYEKELRNAKAAALEALTDEASALGADAVVAVDLDYEVIGGDKNTMLMVSANGTAGKLG